MPIYHNNILCVTSKELEACGVSAGYLKRALAGQRNGEVYCWEYHKEGKRVFIHYNLLKPIYKNAIKAIFCDNIEPDVFLKNNDTSKAKAEIENITDQITGLIETNPDDIKFIAESGLYTPLEVHQLARAAAWLRLINEFDVKKARKLGFVSIVTFRNEVFKRCLNEQNAKPTPLIRFRKGAINNERVLYRNAEEYKNVGISCLLHKGAGNVNREKADTVVHAKLIELASNPVKYSWEDVSMMYNDWAKEHSKPQITTSTIKDYLNTPKIKKVWFYSRHGKLAADNEIQQLINRDKPSFPDALWSCDGTTMQLYYRNEKGEIQSDLYCYFVTDAHTGAIIGHSIAYAETSGMVEEALRNAVNNYGYKPYQLQYDNSSANKAVVIKNLMQNMSRVYFPCEPLKGRSKYVEGIIGHFQQRVLRKKEEFKGGNITSGSLNSKANPELLAKLKKNPEQLLSLEAVIEEFNASVQEWNNRGEKRDSFGHFVGDSKIHKYTTIQHEKRVKINYFDTISLFMVEQKLPYTYSTNGIIIELDKKKYQFIVPDSETDYLSDFIFANEHLGEKFMVKVDRNNPDMCALYQNDKFVEYAYIKGKVPSCVADLKPGDKAKQVEIKTKQDEWGHIYAAKELERQLEILGEIKSTGTDGMGWWDTPKVRENARQNEYEDIKNGISDGLTDRQRRILNIGK